MNTNQNHPKQTCIFCWRTNDEVAFSIEHVIPDAIGGLLRIEDYVCTECNSILGSNVDYQILRNPDVLAAQKVYASEERYNCTRNHNFETKLISEDGSEFLAHEKIRNRTC